MWFNDRKQESVPEVEPGHKSPDDMVRLDQPFTQFEELDDLSDPDLSIISQLCTEGTYDSVNCVPCRAGEILEERRGTLLPEEPMEPNDFNEDYATPKLDALMAEEPPFVEKPVAEQFADKVAELEYLVRQVLTGPPIPPPNVSLDDLAALVVAAEMWVKMINAQGLELGPTQNAVKTQVETLIERFRR